METLKAQFDKDRQSLITKIKDAVAYFELQTGTLVKDINIEIITHERSGHIDGAFITNIGIFTSMDEEQRKLRHIEG